MSACADTGFIASLYLREDTTAVALQEMRGLTEPILLSWLGELELLSAFRRAVFTGRITAAQGLQVEQQFSSDRAMGMFVEREVDTPALATDAKVLLSRYTATLGLRTLDALHISMATLMRADGFLSFDRRQRAAASAVSMKVLPLVV